MIGTSGGMMPADSIKALIRQFWEEYWNQGDVAVADEILEPAYAERDKPWHTFIRSVLPDLNFEIQDLLVDGNKVVSRIHWRGTHRGEFNGIAPSGKVVSGSGIWIHQIEDGKLLLEHWEVAQALNLGQQLTLILDGTVEPPLVLS